MELVWSTLLVGTAASSAMTEPKRGRAKRANLLNESIVMFV
jgi:hypothetical protein